ncbi:MAG: gluconate transporter [Verrucomicrobiales bacterium]|nr:gluconate transporter [Verrucomicrobiales bacterium]
MESALILLAGIAVVVTGILVLRLHAFLALIAAAMVVATLTSPNALSTYAAGRKMSAAQTKTLLEQPVGERVAREFGNTCGKVGLLIVLAAVIGKCLMQSGAADRIVRSALHCFGEPRAPVAFLGTGFLLGIAVFEAVFYLLMPIGKAMRLRTGKNYALYIMTIIAGTSMAHSLVPPSPGPLIIAHELNIDLGTSMIAGIGLGLFTITTGLIYALWLNRRIEIPLRDSPDSSLADLKQLAELDDAQLPPLWLALTPILLPILLIGANSFQKITNHGQSRILLQQLGDPNVALLFAAVAAVYMLARQKKQRIRELATDLQSSLAAGGLMLLIIAGGGAFGGVLQQTGIGDQIQAWSAHYSVAVLPMAFLLTVLLRTAQGSATVSMITTASMLAPMALPTTLGFHPVYLALAIGCGSKPFPWMNDAGFWVISKMSGMTVGETIKLFSCLITTMALVGILLLMLCARLFPMV